MIHKISTLKGAFLKMRILRFRIEKQRISKSYGCDFSGIVKGTSGYLIASFSFSEEWDGCKKAASFWRLGKEYPALIINGQCEIPKEALTWDNFQVSVTGVCDNFVITTNKITVEQG